VSRPVFDQVISEYNIEKSCAFYYRPMWRMGGETKEENRPLSEGRAPEGRSVSLAILPPGRGKAQGLSPTRKKKKKMLSAAERIQGQIGPTSPAGKGEAERPLESRRRKVLRSAGAR